MSTLALVVMDTGSPGSEAEVKPFLKRLYSDSKVVNSPVGADYTRLFAGLTSWPHVKPMKAAVQKTGGAPERAPLEQLASSVAAQLSSSGGDTFRPYVAFRHSEPGLHAVVKSAKAEGASKAVLLFARPLAHPAASGSVERELRDLSIDEPDFEVTLVDRTPPIPELVSAYAATAKAAFEALPADARSKTLVLFTLRALPSPDDADPSLEAADALMRAVAKQAELPEPTLVFQGRTAPAMDRAPDLFVRLAREKGKSEAVLLVPLTGFAESHATLYELDVLAREAAQQNGISNFARAACPAGRPELVDALAITVRRHLEEQAALRAGA